MDPERNEGFERTDPLWDVLGRASQPPEASPYFARRVLRDLDLPEAKPAAGWFARSRWLQTLAPVAAAITLLLGAAHFWMPTAVAPTEVALVDENQLPANPDQRISVVLADLDELIAFEDPAFGDDEGSWQ